MARMSLPIGPKNRKVGRFIAKVRSEIQRAFTEERISQAEVAQALGVNRAIVNRRLKGDMNLTLRTIGEMAWALGDREIVFELRKAATNETGWNHQDTVGTSSLPTDSQTTIELV